MKYKYRCKLRLAQSLVFVAKHAIFGLNKRKYSLNKSKDKQTDASNGRDG